MMADKLSLAALIAANAFEKARAKRRNIPYTPFAPTKSQLEDWKEVVLAVRAADHAQPKPASPWRDIESAPKDGTDFLALIPYNQKHHQMVGCFAPEGKFRSWPSRHEYRPTHWMPLPEQPR